MTRGSARDHVVHLWNRAIRGLAWVDPVVALRVAASVGSLAGRLNLVEPRVSDVEKIAPALGVDVPSLRLEMAASERRTRAFELIALRMNREQIVRLVRWDESSLEKVMSLAKAPAILVFWHLGPANAIPFALSAAGIEALVISAEKWPHPPPGIEVVATGRGAGGASSFRTALERLRSGGIVLIAADVSFGAPAPPAPCLGRMVQFRRGPVALARITGARVIPIVATWERGRMPIAISLRDPLSIEESREGDVESAWAAAIAGAFEKEFRVRPESLRTGKLAMIAASPSE